MMTVSDLQDLRVTPAGSGEMTRRIQDYDWSTTQLGPMEAWPAALRFAVDLMLAMPQPVWIGWGSELIQLYNDDFIGMLGDERHPGILGNPTADTWTEIWPRTASDLMAILSGGPAVCYENRLHSYRRAGEVRDRYFTYSYSPIPDADAPSGVGGVFCICIETTASIEVRNIEDRQAFLLELADALRPLGDPIEIQETTSRLIGEYLGVSRAFYGTMQPDGLTLVIERDFHQGVQSVAGSYRLLDYRTDLQASFNAGQTVVVADGENDPLTVDDQAAALAALNVRAWVAVPLVKSDRLVAVLCVHHSEPRNWSDFEISLMQEVAERTWAAVEQAQAEAELRASDERYRAIVEQANDYAILTTDTANRIVSWGAGAEAVFGWQAEEVLGQEAAIIFTLEDRVAGIPAQEFAVARERGTAPDVRWHLRKDGVEVFIDGVSQAIHDATGTFQGVLKIGQDITERHRAQESLRIRESHQAFLVRLVDLLRPLADPHAIQQEVLAAVGEHLQADRVLYAETTHDGEWIDVAENYVRDDFPELVGRFPISSFGTATATLRSGTTLVISDMDAAALSETEKTNFRAIQVHSAIAVPIIKGGRWVSNFGVHHGVPRAWTVDDVRLLEDVAERTWVAIEHGRAEEALRESEAKYRALFESMDQGFAIAEIIVGDAGNPVDYRMLEMNPQFERMTGQPADRFLSGQTVRQVAPELEEHWYEIYGRVGLTGEAAHLELPAEHWDRWFSVSAYRTGAPEQRRVAILFSEITDRKRAEGALRESEASLAAQVAAATTELRQLSRRLLTIQEEERRHLARELHDEIGQVLTALNLQLTTGSTEATLAEARRMVQELTEQVRQLSMDLRPATLETHGLLPTLLGHLERFQQRTGIVVDLRHEGVDRRFPGSVEITAYRIVQEALTNVARHADAQQAVVQLMADREALTVVIRDDGCGFDAATAPQSSGLGGMRERVELIGGDLTIDTRPGEGTVVTAEVPLIEERLLADRT
jgi:PAS domain S-box-containing protein